MTGRWEAGRDAGEDDGGGGSGVPGDRTAGVRQVSAGGGPKLEASQLAHSRTQPLRALLLAPRLF